MGVFLISPVYLWLIIMALCLIVELFIFDFSLVSFSVGAGVTALVSLLGISLVVQLLVFCIASLLMFMFIRPLFLKILLKKKDPVLFGVESYIGKTYPLIEDCDESTGLGKIKIGSEVWRVESDNKDAIKKGEMVIMRDIKGTTLIVERVIERVVEKVVF